MIPLLKTFLKHNLGQFQLVCVSKKTDAMALHGYQKVCLAQETFIPEITGFTNFPDARLKLTFTHTQKKQDSVFTLK